LEDYKKMNFTPDSTNNSFDRNSKYVNPGVQICIECGNILVLIYKSGITCKNCGSKKEFLV